MDSDRLSSPRPTKGRAPHRRNEEARLAVLHAADDLLVERGYSGVTVEGIATRAGVAKQTIYRWWPSKVDILLDTLIEDAAERLAPRSTGAVGADVRRYLRALARFLTRDDAGRVFLALLGEAQHDAAVAEIFALRFLRPQRVLERELLPVSADRDAVLDALTGPIIYRALTGAKIGPKFIDGLIAGALGPDPV